jgi:hydrogenase maturation protease
LLRQPQNVPFSYPSRHTIEPLRESDRIKAILIRDQQPINGTVEISASRIFVDLFKLTIRITNETQLAELGSRDQALMQSLISTHTLLGVEDGDFVSLTDPPDIYTGEARACRNIGAWPVLVGDGVQRDTILSSPIILYDYPQLAPESPGDLFDSTEIDEILTLRILTLTDDEKRAAAGVDDRVRDLLSRTESLARDQLMNLHGAVRGLRPVAQEQHNE